MKSTFIKDAAARKCHAWHAGRLLPRALGIFAQWLHDNALMQVHPNYPEALMRPTSLTLAWLSRKQHVSRTYCTDASRAIVEVIWKNSKTFPRSLLTEAICQSGSTLGNLSDIRASMPPLTWVFHSLLYALCLRDRRHQRHQPQDQALKVYHDTCVCITDADSFELVGTWRETPLLAILTYVYNTSQRAPCQKK